MKLEKIGMYQKKLKKSLQSFEDFRDRYFLKQKLDNLYETANFHKNWIKNILNAIDKGGQQMILSAHHDMARLTYLHTLLYGRYVKILT